MDINTVFRVGGWAITGRITAFEGHDSFEEIKSKDGVPMCLL